jgi:hypothetical protein
VGLIESGPCGTPAPNTTAGAGFFKDPQSVEPAPYEQDIWRKCVNRLFPLPLAALCLTAPASAQIASFQHVIVVV